MEVMSSDHDNQALTGTTLSPITIDQAETVQLLQRRLAEAVLAQEAGRREQARKVVGLHEQVDRLTRQVATLETKLANHETQEVLAVRPESSLRAWVRNGFQRIGLTLGLGRPAGLEHAVPLFVLGCPRSGTTLLAKILNEHPAVLMTNETAVFLFLADAIEKSRVGYAAGLLYGKEHNYLWAEHLAGHSRSLIESFYTRIAVRLEKRGLRYWGEKHPHHTECFDFIEKLYPAARYIYIVRDPRDSALSIKHMLQIPFAEALAAWKVFSDAYEHFITTRETGHLYQLRYEDLVNDYDGLTRQVFTWLGLTVQPVERFLKLYRNVDAHSLSQAVPITSDFRLKAVNRWRRELSSADCRLADELVGPFLDKYGYDRST